MQGYESLIDQARAQQNTAQTYGQLSGLGATVSLPTLSGLGATVSLPTLSGQVAEAHDIVEHLSKIISGLETRLMPVLSLSGQVNQVGSQEKSPAMEPALLDETARLLARMRDIGNRLDDIERRVRI